MEATAAAAHREQPSAEASLNQALRAARAASHTPVNIQLTAAFGGRAHSTGSSAKAAPPARAADTAASAAAAAAFLISSTSPLGQPATPPASAAPASRTADARANDSVSAAISCATSALPPRHRGQCRAAAAWLTGQVVRPAAATADLTAGPAQTTRAPNTDAEVAAVVSRGSRRRRAAAAARLASGRAARERSSAQPPAAPPPWSPGTLQNGLPRCVPTPRNANHLTPSHVYFWSLGRPTLGRIPKAGTTTCAASSSRLLVALGATWSASSRRWPSPSWI